MRISSLLFEHRKQYLGINLGYVLPESPNLLTKQFKYMLHLFEEKINILPNNSTEYAMKKI
jgi:hypothetical protein